MTTRALLTVSLLVGLVAGAAIGEARAAEAPAVRLYVHAKKGRDRNPGTRSRPCRTLGGAIAKLPEPLAHSVTIEVAAGRHEKTGFAGACLYLAVRMRPGVEVTIVGTADNRGQRPVLAWEGGRAMVHALEGRWKIGGLIVGSSSVKQRRGVLVEGPAHVTLTDITFRTRSHSGAGIEARRGGRIELRGKIHLNEHLHEEAPDESFSGIIAFDHGVVKFVQREGAELDIGNGSLSAGYYGVIRLGCARARVTSWGRQSNNLAVNNGGRIDLHGTPIKLEAKRPENTPIGPEHDGHILGEDARILIVGKNRCAIALQKASTLFCNDIELRGTFRLSLWAMSGSVFVGGFLSDVTAVEAHTGAVVHIGKVGGKLVGPVTAKTGAVVSLPDGTVKRGNGRK